MKITYHLVTQRNLQTYNKILINKTENLSVAFGGDIYPTDAL